MTTYKEVKITDFLTHEQIRHCAAICETVVDHDIAKEIDKQVITPNIEEINRKLGQENVPRYLAYMIYYAFVRGVTNEA